MLKHRGKSSRVPSFPYRLGHAGCITSEANNKLGSVDLFVFRRIEKEECAQDLRAKRDSAPNFFARECHLLMVSCTRKIFGMC